MSTTGGELVELQPWGCAHAGRGMEVDDARAHHVAERVILSLDDKHGRTRHLGVNYDLHLRSVVVGHPPAVEVIRLIHAGAAPLGARGGGGLGWVLACGIQSVGGDQDRTRTTRLTLIMNRLGTVPYA